MPRPQTASPAKSPKKSRGGPSVNLAAPTSVDYENLLSDQQHQMSMQVSEKEIEIERLKTTVVSLNAKCSNVNDIEEDFRNASTRFDDSEAQRTKLQEHIVLTSQKVEQDASNHAQYQQELMDQINELQKKLDQEKQRQNKKDTQHRNEMDKVNNKNDQEMQNVRQEMEQVRSNLQRQNEQVRNQLQSEMEQVRQNLDSQMQQLRNEKDNIIAQLEDEMEAQRVSTTQNIDMQNNKMMQQTQKILNLESQVLSQKAMITKKEDVERQLSIANNHIDQLVGQKDNLQKELDHATDYILELEEKVYKANKTSLELLKQLKDAEVEIETLKQYIIDLKQRIAVYIPVKEDAIDKKLAEFINNYPERSKLKIMFMRESEGVYQFGTKRVAVKVEKDAIKIRVGGGYLSIDEFLDQYTPVELEKLERKDPLKRFSEKVAIQKTIVNAGVRESSPVMRSPGRSSPGRKTAV